MHFGKWKREFGLKIRHLTTSVQHRVEPDGSRVPIVTVDMYQVRDRGRPDTLVQVWIFHDWVDDPDEHGSTHVFTFPMSDFWRELRKQKRLLKDSEARPMMPMADERKEDNLPKTHLWDL